MPECYTHVHTATQALMRSGHTVASTPAFMAGANGPDPFFFFQVWKRYAKPNLRGLAAKMHREKTGAFLGTLVRHATTPAQQSYVLGFLTHYTTDCTLNPYIAAMSSAGAPYSEPMGKYKMETDLDSQIYYDDYKTRLVPLHAGTPVLITGELAEVCTLLRTAVEDVYGVNLPLIALADAFHDNLSTRRMLISRTGLKKLVIKIIQPHRPSRYGPPLSYHVQPGKRLRRLPEKWTNPFTGDDMNLNLREVLSLAVQTGAVCITAAMRYWLGEVDDETMAAVLGDNDYHTGTPCKTEKAPDSATAPSGQAPAGADVSAQAAPTV